MQGGKLKNRTIKRKVSSPNASQLQNIRQPVASKANNDSNHATHGVGFGSQPRESQVAVPESVTNFLENLN